MPRQIIRTPNAPSSPLFSQGVKVASQVLVSGTTGVDPSTGELAGSSFQAQTPGASRLRGHSAGGRRNVR